MAQEDNFFFTLESRWTKEELEGELYETTRGFFYKLIYEKYLEVGKEYYLTHNK
jgi:hypothetical protein